MPSQFFGLNIGASALTAFQASINTTANNVANVKTKGYSRQTTTLEASSSIRVAARYGNAGTGVSAVSILQERDLYYDAKYWTNNGSKGYYEQKVYYMQQLEQYFKDDEVQDGFSTLMGKMFNGLDLVKNSNGDETIRNQFINQAQSLCTYFNNLSVSLSGMQEDCNEEIWSTVDNINAIGQKISLLNKEINNLEIRGGHANELRDQRANLLDELSLIVDVETNEYEVENLHGENLGGTNFTVIINGQVLVDNFDYRTLECTSQDHLYSQSDIQGLYSIRWADTKMEFAAATTSANGTLKALFDLRDGNGNAGLYGGVRQEGTDSNHVTIENPSITDVSNANFPTKGQITVGNKVYIYNGWSAELDEEGNMTSVTFDLETPIDPAMANSLVGKKLEVGKNIDTMGVPYYQHQINSFLRKFTEMFNDIEKTGVTLDGEPMDAFFVALNKTDTQYVFDEWPEGNTPRTITSDSDVYYQMTGANIAVNQESLRNPRHFSAASEIINGQDKYDIAEQLKTLQEDVIIFRGNNAGSFLETLLSDVSVDTEKAELFAQNYNNLEVTIGNYRTSISGVDEDEEALNLSNFQYAYNLASKVISVMAQLYDKLINETGIA